MEQNRIDTNVNKKLIVGVGALMVTIVVLIVATVFLVPEGTHPAYAVAVEFVNSAATGDDESAVLHMSDTLMAYVADNCPDGVPSTCIAAYADESWGGFSSAVYRRSVPDGTDAWDVQLIATYEDGQGFSGICIYNRVEQIEGEWQVVRWSGFVSCDLPTAGLQQLAGDDAPNRVPAE